MKKPGMKAKTAMSNDRITLEEACAKLKSSDSFLLTSHTSPDGDAIGSLLGCYHFLNDIGKENVVCAMHDTVPPIYNWLPGTQKIVHPAAVTGEFDLVVILDVAGLPRIGGVHELISAEQTILVLDHHLEENPCGTYNYIDATHSSASEIVLDLYEIANIPVSENAAECIYTGLVADTGGFRYGNTNAESHRHAGILIAAGADPSSISSRVFDDMSMAKFDLLKRILGRMVLGAGGRFAYSYLLESDLQEADATSDDIDGLVNFARNIEGVIVGALFREMPGNRTKVSMRSRGEFNSSACLKAFGGGGHAGAAGATLDMPIKVGRDAIIHAVEAAIK